MIVPLMQIHVNITYASGPFTCADGDLRLIPGDDNVIAEVVSFAFNFDTFLQVFLEVTNVKDAVLGRVCAVNREFKVDFPLHTLSTDFASLDSLLASLGV